MWGLFSKDPTKDFPYENVEQLGQIHLANKTVWSLHSGKHRTTQEPVAIFSCDTKDGASQTQLDIARWVSWCHCHCDIVLSEALEIFTCCTQGCREETEDIETSLSADLHPQCGD